jgi:ribosomal protein S12 methylthiotransferase accessory factor
MSTPPIVYLGPSLPVAEAQRILEADYRPPIKRGDLPAHYDGTVVIIDGEFGQNLSVSPNEILQLLDQGMHVIGASSMGAL